MRGVILQPSYIPWRGYFDLIHRADVFVFLDDVQYTKRDWRNRNIIKGRHGLQWLTVPVLTSGRREQLIKDVEIDNTIGWKKSHLSTIRHCYGHARYYDAYAGLIEARFAEPWRSLCDLDIDLTRCIAALLGIDTKYVRSSELSAAGTGADRLINICQEIGITTYISGPSAKAYIAPGMFEGAGIELVYHTYEYPEYPQPHGSFAPNVTILDLLFNCGDESPRYIWKS